MIDEIKLMLGEASTNFTNEQISLYLKQSIIEVESYCQRKVDAELEMVAERITVIKLNRLHSEGLDSQSYSGVSESYTNGYPEDIKAILNRKRKLKVIY